MRRTILGLVAVGAAGFAAWPSPIGAAPALAPGFAATICYAHPPHMDHSWARAIQYAAPGSAIRVADTAISNEDHAELLFKLGLLQGHLMIGRELIDANQVALALPHFGHPIRELYDDISGELARRGITGFDGELIGLEALAAGKPRDAATRAKYDEVMRVLAAVRATVPSGLLNNEAFMLGVVGEVVTVGAEDYNESIESGRIAKPVEYHDSRGYLEYVDQELKRLEARPEGKASPRLDAARARFTEMQAIVAPLLPPDKPIRTVAQYKAIVAQFKLAVRTGGA